MEIIATSHALYTCSLKLLLRKDTSYLLLRDAEGYIDLPGGRIDTTEYTTPISKILQREVAEELGDSLKFQISKPIFQFRRNFDAENTRVFISVYLADFLTGTIRLSDEHQSFQWLTKNEIEFHESDFREHEEYLAFHGYFEQLLK